MSDLTQLPSTLLLPNIQHSCYNDWPIPPPFQSAVTQHTSQLLQWLTYPNSLPLCCYPTYNTAATMTDLSQLPSTLLLPNIQHSHSWIANSCSLSRKVSHSFGNIHWPFTKSPQFILMLSQIEPIGKHILYWRFKLIMLSSLYPWCQSEIFNSVFWPQFPYFISEVPHNSYMPFPSHSHSFCNREIIYTSLCQMSTPPNDSKH